MATPAQRLPEWLRRPPQSTPQTHDLKRLLRSSELHTVCEEARCPNISECFGQGTATFMILGDVCTRGCKFCSVTTGLPVMKETAFEAEGVRVAEAAKTLGLQHVVVTSVARDDLADGGARGFVETIAAIREMNPSMTVEVLIPDFRGNKKAIEALVLAKPDVLNHNIETVPRLYRKVRPGSSYKRSLELLAYVKECDSSILTKTGIMLGLGESKEEVLEVFKDSHDHKIDIFTAGQYMQPTRGHLPVEEYVSPDDFSWYESQAKEIGFKSVSMGPLVRSSYNAKEVFEVIHG